ncbi:MAG: DNA replication/repair protein RecF [Alphaproteobacteria bacterium]
MYHLNLQEIGINAPMAFFKESSASQIKTGVTKLFLSNFRNYQNLEITTELAPIVLYGTNGSGKTNLLEALSFLIPGRGLRRTKLSDITNNGEASSHWALCANISTNGREFQVGTGLEINSETNREKRIVKIDGKMAKSQSDLGDVITAVWLTPEMDRLFRGGSASSRRRFLDRLVYAYDPEHVSRLSSYENALKQWLFIVRSEKQDKIWLSSLEETLAEKSVSIAAARKETVARLNHIAQENSPEFPIAYLSLDGMVEEFLDRCSAIEAEDKVKQFFNSWRKKAVESQYVADGVHRTDINAQYVQKKIAASNCSTGEQKAILISIILAQARSMVRVLGKAPILLLDEIVAHLDENRRKALFSEICSLNLQAWLTGTEIETFEDLKNSGQFLKVDNAQIKYDKK